MSNEQMVREVLKGVKIIENMLHEKESSDNVYEEFRKIWVEYDKNGGDIEVLLKMFSKGDLVELFYIYLSQHG